MTALLHHAACFYLWQMTPRELPLPLLQYPAELLHLFARRRSE